MPHPIALPGCTPDGRLMPAHLAHLPYVTERCRADGKPATVTGWETPGDALPVFDTLTVDGVTYDVTRAYLTFKGDWEFDCACGAEFTIRF